VGGAADSSVPLPSALKQPEQLQGLMRASYGINDGHLDWLKIGAAATVWRSMVAQIGEQVDFLRFMPEPRSGRARWRWWAALMAAGPGWIVLGAAKMLGGAVLAFLVIRQGVAPGDAIKPVQMYLGGYAQVFGDPRWVVGFTCLFVIVSQMKILVTNAYAGSLAWSNFFARLTHSAPGARGVAGVQRGHRDIADQALGVFAALEHVAGRVQQHRHRVGRGAGGRPGHQQAAQAEPAGPSSSSARTCTTSTRSAGVAGGSERRWPCWPLRARWAPGRKAFSPWSSRW
jgi:hypothetical protein